MSTSVQIVKDTVSGGLSRLKTELSNGKKIFEVCELAKSLIVIRTLSGQDVDGTTFEPYSSRPYYAAIDDLYRPEGYPKPAGGRTTHKRNPGRKLKRMAFDEGYGQYKTGIGRPAFVQLSISGQMLADIETNVLNESEGELYFASAHSAAKAQGHHTGANNLPVREFFDLSEGNVSQMATHLAKLIREYVQNAGLS